MIKYVVADRKNDATFCDTYKPSDLRWAIVQHGRDNVKRWYVLTGFVLTRKDAQKICDLLNNVEGN